MNPILLEAIEKYKNKYPDKTFIECAKYLKIKVETAKKYYIFLDLENQKNKEVKKENFMKEQKEKNCEKSCQNKYNNETNKEEKNEQKLIMNNKKLELIMNNKNIEKIQQKQDINFEAIQEGKIELFIRDKEGNLINIFENKFNSPEDFCYNLLGISDFFASSILGKDYHIEDEDKEEDNFEEFLSFLFSLIKKIENLLQQDEYKEFLLKTLFKILDKNVLKKEQESEKMKSSETKQEPKQTLNIEISSIIPEEILKQSLENFLFSK